MFIKLLMGAALAASTPTYASTVAILDSGTDWEHKDLASHVWLNAADTPDNDKDDDNDGYVDDVHGWNFADANNVVIDRSYIGTFSDDCYKYFEVQGRVLRGTATDEDKEWIKKKKEDQQFIQELSTFGNFVHGTHVSGIASTSRTTETILATKILKTSQGFQSLFTADFPRIKAEIAAANDDDALTGLLVQWYIGSLVDQQITPVVDAGNYATLHKADVANGSFGISYSAAETAVKALLNAFGSQDPSDETVKKYALYLIDKVNEKCKEFIDKGTETLFVFAAGNDGTNNDDQPMSPANVGADNSMSIAATMDRDSLASFSNYGIKTVDVAAPGVMIKSTIPGDKYLELSGTSMAAPYVTEVAALVKDANPKLKPVEIKKILMDTVDKLDSLKDKVKAGGIVNPERAVAAAKASVSAPLAEAIASVQGQFQVQLESRGFTGDQSEIYVTPLVNPLF